VGGAGARREGPGERAGEAVAAAGGGAADRGGDEPHARAGVGAAGRIAQGAQDVLVDGDVAGEALGVGGEAHLGPAALERHAAGVAGALEAPTPAPAGAGAEIALAGAGEDLGGGGRLRVPGGRGTPRA